MLPCVVQTPKVKHPDVACLDKAEAKLVEFVSKVVPVLGKIRWKLGDAISKRRGWSTTPQTNEWEEGVRKEAGKLKNAITNIDYVLMALFRLVRVVCATSAPAQFPVHQCGKAMLWALCRAQTTLEVMERQRKTFTNASEMWSTLLTEEEGNVSPMPSRPVNDSDVVSTIQTSIEQFNKRFSRTMLMIRNFMGVFRASVPVDLLVDPTVVDVAMGLKDPTTPNPELLTFHNQRTRLFFEGVYADVHSGATPPLATPRPLKRRRVGSV